MAIDYNGVTLRHTAPTGCYLVTMGAVLP